jgi:nitrous oxidase accessory protein NosD
MAIQNNIAEGNSQYGIAFNNAYYRIVTAAISRQRGTDPKFSVMIDLSAYTTATPGDDTREVDFKRYNANLDDVQAASGRHGGIDCRLRSNTCLALVL